MNNRKVGIIILMSFILLVVFLVTLLAILSSFPTNNSGSDQIGSTSSHVNIPTLSESTKSKGVFAGVSANKTIDIVNNDGTTKVINLSDRNWHNIQISPNGKFLSVLGITTDNVANLFIYNFETGMWSQATAFSSNSISSYTWSGDSELFFIQGTDENHWVHKYDVLNQQSIKIFRTSGEIENYFSSLSQIVIKKPLGEGYIFELFNIEGEKLTQFSGEDTPDSDDYLFHFMIGGNDRQIYLGYKNSASELNYLSWSIDDPEIHPVGFTSAFLVPICSGSDNVFGIDNILGDLSYAAVSISTGEYSQSYPITISTQVLTKPDDFMLDCLSDGTILWRLENISGNTWMSANIAGEENSLNSLKNYSEVKLLPQD